VAAFLSEIEFWWWWALAAFLLVVEILAPGFVFLWFAAAAAVMGFLLLFFAPLDWHVQLIIFAVLGVVALVVGRAIFRRAPPPSDRPTLNRRGEAYIGRHLTLIDPIRDGLGWARVDDTRWRIEGPDLPAGSQVRVVGADGSTLKVAAAP